MKFFGCSGSSLVSRRSSTWSRITSSGMDPGSLVSRRRPSRTNVSGLIDRRRARTTRSPTPSRPYTEKAARTAGCGRPPRVHGNTEALSTSPATRSGSTAAWTDAIRPPIELPITMIRPLPASSTNRARERRRSITLVPRPTAGDRPNPGRSSARTRPSPESPEPTWSQLRCDPPRPWTRTNVVSGGPSHVR